MTSTPSHPSLPPASSRPLLPPPPSLPTFPTPSTTAILLLLLQPPHLLEISRLLVRTVSLVYHPCQRLDWRPFHRMPLCTQPHLLSLAMVLVHLPLHPPPTLYLDHH